MKKLIFAFIALTNFQMSASAKAEELEFEASNYYCKKLGGTPQGNNGCTASYQPYPKNACRVYASAPEHDGGQDAIIAKSKGASCSSDVTTKAKSETLRLRAELMSYVSLGRDESINDPVENESKIPKQDGSVPYWPMMQYFANECAVQSCSSSGEQEVQAEERKKTQNAAKGPTSEETRNNSTRQSVPLAGLRMCNKTKFLVVLTIASKIEGSRGHLFNMKGWYQITAGNCVNLGKQPRVGFWYFAKSQEKSWPKQSSIEIMKNSGRIVLCMPQTPFRRTGDDSRERWDGCESGSKLFEMEHFILQDEAMNIGNLR